jgi:hypothetical protein
MLFPSNQEMPVRQIACANSFSVTEYYPSIPMALAILLFVTTVSAFGQGQFERKGTPLILSDSWTATDALGRKLPDHNSVGDIVAWHCSIGRGMLIPRQTWDLPMFSKSFRRIR